MSTAYHDVHDFIRAMSDTIKDEYDRIQRRALDDPGTAGDEGEENWRSLLEGWLPKGYTVVTKGRILGFDGESSPQMDVIVLRPSYPQILIKKKHYLIGGVAAAFECKLTLNAAHVTEAVKTGAKLRRLIRPRFGTPYFDLTSPLLYGILSHAHSWNAASSTPYENIRSALDAADATYVEHPREMIDFICVANLGGFASGRSAKVSVPCVATGADGQSWPSISEVPQTATSYNEMRTHDDKYNAIGMLLVRLTHKLAYEDPSLRELSMDLSHIGFPGQGLAFDGRQRVWPESVISNYSRENLPQKYQDCTLIVGEHKHPWNQWKAIYY
ncbi:DUF6602 domain-containing protein [Paraperlucidibaca wandonensis]|uniref:DUF6602 domain-containing protein n=1 Tax=Paraperlucidibaca wandonensis TaxID=1268273 RepID=A0ABW3HG60_9GAMM